MANPLTTLQSEWPVVSQAPWSFLAIVALVAAVVWWIACKYYAGRIAELTEQKSTLEHRVQARNDEIQALNAKLADAQAAPKPPQRADPDEIEQSGRIVGKLHGPEVRRGEGVVLASSLTANGDYNPERLFTFRDMTLKLLRCDTIHKTKNAGEVRQQFAPALCEILP